MNMLEALGSFSGWSHRKKSRRIESSSESLNSSDWNESVKRADWPGSVQMRGGGS